MDKIRRDPPGRSSVEAAPSALIGTFTKWPLAWRLGAAALAVLGGMALRFAMFGALGDRLAYVTLYPAVAVAAVVGGLSGGVLATILSALAAHFLIAPFSSRADLLGLAAFLLSSAITVAMARQLRRAQIQIASAELIRQREKQLGQFVEQAPAAVAMFDRDMRYLAASARWRDDFNLRRDLVGKSHYDALPEIPEQWKEIHQRGLAGEILRADEDPLMRLDGSIQWIKWEVRPWRDGRGEIGGLLIGSEDVTEKKRVDDALRESLKEVMDLKAALDEHALVTIADPHGVITYANDQFCAVSKYARAELLGRNHRILKSGFHPPELFRELWTTIASGRVWRGEVMSRAKDGSFYWAATTIVPFLDRLGRPRHYVAIRTDITERVIAQNALRDSERRLQAIFDSAMEAIVTIDKNGVIQAANPAALEMFGYETEEILGRNVKLLMPEPAASMHDRLIARYMGGGDAMLINNRRQVLGLRKNGEVFPKELTLTEASIDQDVLFIGFMRDLTQIENEKRKTEAARAELLHVARLSDMGEVAAGLAHEVSQPLTAIQCYASACRRGISAETEPKVAQAIEVIETQAKNATDILNRLRGFIEKREFSALSGKSGPIDSGRYRFGVRARRRPENTHRAQTVACRYRRQCRSDPDPAGADQFFAQRLGRHGGSGGPGSRHRDCDRPSGNRACQCLRQRLGN